MAPVQPETERSITRRPEAERRESSFLWTLTGPVARVVFAVPFFVFGINHFAMTSQMAGVVPGWLPVPAFWVYLTGAAHLAASIAIMANRLIRPAGILLAVMLLTFVVTIHIPAVAAGDMSALTNLLKDVSLAGGALMAAHFYVHQEPEDVERSTS